MVIVYWSTLEIKCKVFTIGIVRHPPIRMNIDPVEPTMAGKNKYQPVLEETLMNRLAIF